MFSKIVEVGELLFPSFNLDNLYMHKFDFSNPLLPNNLNHWMPQFSKMVSLSKVNFGIGWVTIDQKQVTVGNSHRRPGPHIDGNYEVSEDWSTGGGNGWLVGGDGSSESLESIRRAYHTKMGGIMLASDYSSCRAYHGEYTGLAAAGGDCSHINVDSMEEVILKPNTIYLGNHCIHESMEVEKSVNRSLIRITLPNTFVLQGSIK